MQRKWASILAERSRAFVNQLENKDIIWKTVRLIVCNPEKKKKSKKQIKPIRFNYDFPL